MRRVIVLAAVSLSFAASSFLLVVGSQGTAVGGQTLAQMRGGNPNQARCDSYCDVEAGVGPACGSNGAGCKICVDHNPDGSLYRSGADYLDTPGKAGCDATGNKKYATTTASCGVQYYGYCSGGNCYGGVQPYACVVTPVVSQ
jgi:hypothetical protein